MSVGRTRLFRLGQRSANGNSPPSVTFGLGSDGFETRECIRRICSFDHAFAIASILSSFKSKGATTSRITSVIHMLVAPVASEP